MIYRTPIPDDEFLTRGVMSRRVLAWLLDCLLLSVLLGVLALVLLMFGLLTFGLGLPLLGILPVVPFAYRVLCVAGPASATLGQRAFGLVVRRNEDLGQPSLLQAVISTLLFALTLAATGLLLLVAVVSTRHRTLHDMGSGLVVVSIDTMPPLTGHAAYGNMQRG